MNTKQLKRKIISLAITGRLVPQDSADEPASELLKRIAPKATPLETEQPLPQGWCACKMGELIDIVSGVSYEKGDVTSNGIRILRGGNIQDGKILTYPDDVFLGTKYRNSTNSVRKGDIVMVASTGSFIALGKTGYCPKDMENTQIGAFLRIIRAKEKSLCPLLNLFFSSDAFKTLIRKSSKGTSINNIKNGYITEIVFSLPPLAEQKRIVEELKYLFAKIDKIECSRKALSKLRKKLKRKIWSLAAEGCLVPQDPADEPASELLKRINPKAKLVQTEQPLPQGWCATTLSTLCKLADGEETQDKELINLEAKFLRGQIKGKKLQSGRLVPANSLLMLVDGENSGEVFRAPIEGYQGSTFKLLVINKNVHEEFVLQAINSYRMKLKRNKRGSATPHLDKKLFWGMQVPIPPLAEQERIIKEVRELFAKLDTLPL